LTKGELLMTRETVFFDTSASRAMSLMVAGFPPVRRVSFTSGFSLVEPCP